MKKIIAITMLAMVAGGAPAVKLCLKKPSSYAVDISGGYWDEGAVRGWTVGTGCGGLLSSGYSALGSCTYVEAYGEGRVNNGRFECRRIVPGPTDWVDRSANDGSSASHSCAGNYTDWARPL